MRERLQNLMYQKLKNDIEGYNKNEIIMKTTGTFYDKSHIYAYYRNKLASSIRNSEPSIVIDFRSVNSLKRFDDLKQLGYFVSNVLHLNRVARVPFQIYFCNYDRSSEFHTMLSPILDLDYNLVFDSSESYINCFAKENLVYLSMSGLGKMESFNTSRVYIIEASLTLKKDPLQQKALVQAKMDGIRCQHLPIADFSE